MALSIPQQALIYFLKKFSLDKEAIIVISLMLSKSDEGIKAFIYLAEEDNISTQEEFLRLAREVVDVLPPEEQTGTLMNLRIKG